MPETEPASRIEIYKLAIEDYHFQVTLNWSRTQYYLGLNVGIIGAGTGILKLGAPGRAIPLVAVVFGVGLITVAFSWIVTARQHAYYRSVRARLKAVESELDLPQELTIRTTEGLKGAPRKGLRRRMTVTNVTCAVFAFLGLIDVFGIIYVSTR